MQKDKQLDQDVLINLIDRLNSYPVGLPDAPEIREFLSIFLEEEEALLASKFPLRESTPEELSKILDWSIEKTTSTLNNMAEKGAVVDYPLGGKSFWILTPSIIGFIEFSLMKMHDDMDMKRMADLLETYEETHLWKEVFGSKTQLTRTLVETGIPVQSEVVTYAKVEEVIRAQGYGALQTCFCRHHSHLLGRDCEIAGYDETCMSLGKAADFVIRRGFGRRVEADELLKITKELGEKGLIHVTDNVRNNPTFICNCCGCCCGLLAGMNRFDLKHTVSPSPYILDIDQEKCIGCGLCTDRCQVNAISEPKEVDGKRIVELDEDKCLGCGACTLACKKDSLSLKKRKKKPKLPRNGMIKFVKIAYEKGRLLPLLKEALRSKMHKLI